MADETATAPGSQPATPEVTADPEVSPASSGSAAAPPAATESPNIRMMREEIERRKLQVEPWEKLGIKPEEAARAHQTYQAITTEAVKLGKELGYEDAYVQQFLQKDPVGTLAQLRQFAKEAKSQPLTPEQIERRLSQKVDERLKSFDQKETERSNKEAEDRYNGERDRQIKAQFKDEEITGDIREFVESTVDDLMGRDPEAIARLREGKTADVAKYVQQAKTRFTKLFTSAQQRERGRGAPPQPGVRPQAKDNPRDRTLGMVPGMKIGDLQALRRG